MPFVAPHLAFPLRLRGGRFVAVEQDSRRHREDQAEIVLRTRPGMLDHDPGFGLRDQVGQLGPVAPAMLEAVHSVVDGDFEARETLSLQGRVRDVAMKIRAEDQEG